MSLKVEQPLHFIDRYKINLLYRHKEGGTSHNLSFYNASESFGQCYDFMSPLSPQKPLKNSNPIIRYSHVTTSRYIFLTTFCPILTHNYPLFYSYCHFHLNICIQNSLWPCLLINSSDRINRRDV